MNASLPGSPSKGDLLSQELFWRNKLAGMLPETQLPTTRERTGDVTQRETGNVTLMLDGDAGQKVLAMTRGAELSVYLVLLTAFDILMTRYLNRGETILGAPPYKPSGDQNASGLLPLRLSFDPSSSFKSCLKSVKQAVIEAYSNQNISYPDLLSAAGIEPSENQSTPIDIVVMLNNIHTFEPSENSLTVAFSIDDNSLGMMLHFDSSKYTKSSIDRLAGHYVALLKGLLSNPDKPITLIGLLPPAERAHMLEEFNDNTQDLPPGTIAALFQEQVARTPDRIAVSCKDETLTYSALNARANRVAHKLQAEGVGPDQVVALLQHRGTDLLTAILGVFKSGAAYLPLDPAFPPDRLNQVITQSRTGLIIAGQSFLQHIESSLDQSSPVKTLTLESLINADQPEDDPSPVGDLSNLAYVIFTSGSTGIPKGAMVDQRGMINHLFLKINEMDMVENDVVAQTASQCFDISVWQYLAPVITGGRVQVADDEDVRDPARLLELVNRVSITILELVPSLLGAVLETAKAEGNLETLTSLRYMMVTGEALPPELCRQWLSLYPDIPLINAYGPTECADDVTHHTINHPPEMDASSVPIGPALANLRLYILDPRGMPLPLNVPGELHVGGIGVGRGYLFDPRRTAEVFIPDPFGSEPGSRLYRTGDLTRYHEDGSIDFLGRIDFQVKIRGFRIELGEIEATLARHAEVKQAVVLAHASGQASKRLIAYVVSEPNSGATDDLDLFLQGILPEYMVPSSFVFLDAFPLTPNGKIDRKTLGAMAPKEDPSRAANAAMVLPESEVEKVLTEIWSEVLGNQQIGIHDNYFELGGDSILSIHIAAKANRKGLLFTPNHLFQHPTIAELSAVAEQSRQEPEEREEITGPVPLTPIQNWFFDLDLEDAHHFNHALMVVPTERLAPLPLERAALQLPLQHDALRTLFEKGDSGWRQVPQSPEQCISFAIIDLSATPETAHRSLLETTAAKVQTQLDFTSGPLCRMTYFDFGPGQEARLLIVIHHLAVDIISWRILLEDLWANYQNLMSSGDTPLMPKTTSYLKWSQRLAEFAHSEIMTEEATYWTEALGKDTVAIPVDHETGPNTVGSVESVSFSLSENKTDLLLHQIPKTFRAQIDEVLLAALAGALTDWAAGDKVAVDLEGHGRQELFGDLNLTRTLGWFATIFPIVLEAKSGQNPEDLLKAVKESLRTIPQEGIGHGILRYLDTDENRQKQVRNLATAEVILNYMGQVHQGSADHGPFRIAGESTGSLRSSLGKRPYLLEIGGSVQSGRLRLSLHFSRNRHRRETIEQLATRIENHLDTFLQRCTQSDVWAFSPSDFPLSDLNAPQLERVIGELSAQGHSPASVEEMHTLSPLQQGILYHHLLAPDSGLYVIQSTRTLYQQVDADVLTRAWQSVLDRHPVLRSSFHWNRLEQPIAVVHRNVHLEPELQDWSGLDPDERNLRLRQYLDEDRRKNFDLNRPMAIRVAFFKMGEEEYQLVWSFHHILLDGWSSSIIIRELAACFAFISVDHPITLPTIRPYRTYISWLKRQNMEEARQFWTHYLEGFSAPTPLGPGRAPNPHDHEGGSQEKIHPLSEDLTKRLTAFAQQQRLTLNTVFQGAWALLLGLYSGEEDVVFGTTVTGRPPDLPGSDDMVGLFINTLPSRARLQQDAALIPWLQAFQAQQSNLRGFDYTPLMSIHGWSDVPRDQPMFQSILVFENYRVIAPVEGGNRSTKVGPGQSFEKTHYPLTLVIEPRARLTLRFLYNPNVFPDVVIENLQTQFEVLLANMTGNTTGKLGDLTPMGATELSRMAEWNKTDQITDSDHLHMLFEDWCRRQTDAPAILFSGAPFTYDRINRAANSLANQLIGRGVDRETPIGVCMDRDPELIISFLGILKAGAVYVSLDPNLPEERLAHMVEDAGISLVMTGETPPALPDSVHTIRVENHLNDTSGSAQNPNLPIAGKQQAYQIFTSGSTGKPKRVMLTHEGLTNMAAAQRKTFHLEPGDRVLQFASLSFDASIFEMVMALGSGATLSMGTRDELLPGEPLLQFLDTHKVNLVTLTPSTLGVLPEAPLTHLHTITVAGEACPRELVTRWAEGRRFFNLYGPTEATIWTTMAPCPPDNTLPPIGKPIANTRVFVLNARLRRLPLGAPGELHIAGHGLARGYGNQPALTAAAFVPDPHAEEPGARLYKTGDIAVFRPDGNLEFLGRRDHQHKIRGFRIEAGEIETVLDQHPEVAQTIVMIHPGKEGEPRLVAYVVRETDSKTGAPTLQSHLRHKLPEYMIPSAFEFIDAFPLLPSGKINLTALPSPRELRPELENMFVAPQAEMEMKLAELWRELLQVDRLGVHDNFFDLGGHSLQLVRLHGRLQESLNRELKLADLFRYPTIHAQVRWLSGEDQPEDTAERENQTLAKMAEGKSRLQRMRKRRQTTPLAGEKGE